jgi:hypothetical protein
MAFPVPENTRFFWDGDERSFEETMGLFPQGFQGFPQRLEIQTIYDGVLYYQTYIFNDGPFQRYYRIEYGRMINGERVLTPMVFAFTVSQDRLQETFLNAVRAIYDRQEYLKENPKNSGVNNEHPTYPMPDYIPRNNTSGSNNVLHRNGGGRRSRKSRSRKSRSRKSRH